MNRKLFEAEMILNGESRESVSNLIGKTYTTTIKKISDGTFTQKEIRKIIDKWGLTPEQSINIFFKN